MARPTATRDVAIILLMLDTGLRVSEVARLRVAVVNEDSGEIHVGTAILLETRLAPIIRSLALTQQAIWSLPNNY